MMSEKVRMLMAKRLKSGIDLAKALGCSSQSVYNKLKKDNWNENDLREVGDYLGCDVEIYFVTRDTHEKI